jgi:rfaE bifunctional protein kinase chain/domain
MANRVLVVGDAMLDVYVSGEVKRISPEAPVPILSNTKEEKRLGGASNVAFNLSKLGIETTLLSIQGHDVPSVHMHQLLMDADVTNFSIKSIYNDTITKTRFVCDNHQLLRLDNEKPFNRESQRQLFESYSGLGDNYDVIVFSDYNKGTLDRLDSMLALKKAGMVIIDPKGKNWDKYRGADLVTPNRAELAEVVGKWDDEMQLQMRVTALLFELNIEHLLLTRSEEGATLFSKFGKVKDYEAKAQQVIDVTGAGDTVVATIAYGISNNLSLDESIELAMKAAGIVVSKFGTSYVTTVELQQMAQ